MEELFANYSLSDIIVFTIILALAIKGCVTFFDWAKARLQSVYDKDYKAKEDKEKIEENIDDLNNKEVKIDEAFAKIDKTFEQINQQIGMLIESDKEDIKSYIVKEHHYFVYQQGWIDDYSLECLERRFAVYQQEHGNSFVSGLMEEIRELPKQPPEQIKHKYNETSKYVEKCCKRGD